jgi:acyl-CoA thioesterase
METTASMINGYGVVHGGYLFLLADTAFAMACATPRGPAVSRQAEITFVAPARAGDRLHAVAIERTSYGRSGIYDVTVSDANGVVYAEMRGHSQVVPRGFPTPRPDGPASTERGAVTAQ